MLKEVVHGCIYAQERFGFLLLLLLLLVVGLLCFCFQNHPRSWQFTCPKSFKFIIIFNYEQPLQTQRDTEEGTGGIIIGSPGRQIYLRL